MAVNNCHRLHLGGLSQPVDTTGEGALPTPLAVDQPLPQHARIRWENGHAVYVPREPPP